MRDLWKSKQGINLQRIINSYNDKVVLFLLWIIVLIIFMEIALSWKEYNILIVSAHYWTVTSTKSIISNPIMRFDLTSDKCTSLLVQKRECISITCTRYLSLTYFTVIRVPIPILESSCRSTVLLVPYSQKGVRTFTVY